MMICLSTAVNAQIVTGQVTDASTENPIPNVNVAAFIRDMALPSTTTDDQGRYSLSLAVGTYEIIANYVGYQLSRETVTTYNKKDTILLDFVLVSGLELPEVEVSYVSPDRSTSSVTSLTRKDFNILPGSFDDPTRLLIKYPAISTVNDQANSVIYRGMPSHYIQWQLNGQEIINPNHTSNAGTLADLYSGSSGGVNMIGGQTIDQATFYGNPNSNANNALSGVNDLVSTEIQDYAQISLLGLELGYNYKGLSGGYRYSFTGLLGNLGVDFGGEKIKFQDINLRYKPQLKKGKLALAVVMGNSANDFAFEDEPTMLKEYQRINYQSEAILTTANYQINGFDINANYSSRSDDRLAFGSVPIGDSVLMINDDSKFRETKIGLSANKKINKSLTIGLDYRTVSYDNIVRFRSTAYNNSEHVGVIRADAIYNQKFNQNVLDISLSPSYRPRYNDFSPDFTLGLKIPLSQSQSLQLRLGHSSQTQPGFVHLFSDASFDLRATKGMHLDMVFASKKSDRLALELQMFYHLLYDVPQTATGYSAFNNLDLPPTDLFTLDDQAKTVGVSGQGEFKLPNKFWINSNVSLFNSSYRTLAVWVPSTQSFGHTFNTTIGKVWTLANNEKFLRCGLSFHHRGGSRVFPIAEQDLLTQYDYRAGPTSSLSDYYRFDFRMSYQFKGGTWSLDIQNVSNRRNDAFFFRDQPSGDIILQRQLGLLPVISYRFKI